MENTLASLLAIGIRGGMFLEFVLSVSRPDRTLSEFEPPPLFLHLIYIMYLGCRHFPRPFFSSSHLCKSLKIIIRLVLLGSLQRHI